jgi:hypothetical protein
MRVDAHGDSAANAPARRRGDPIPTLRSCGSAAPWRGPAASVAAEAGQVKDAARQGPAEPVP